MPVSHGSTRPSSSRWAHLRRAAHFLPALASAVCAARSRLTTSTGAKRVTLKLLPLGIFARCPPRRSAPKVCAALTKNSRARAMRAAGAHRARLPAAALALLSLSALSALASAEVWARRGVGAARCATAGGGGAAIVASDRGAVARLALDDGAAGASGSLRGAAACDGGVRAGLLTRVWVSLRM
jgi:hypothetical protein